MLLAQVLSKEGYRILNYTLSFSFLLFQSKLDTMAVYQKATQKKEIPANRWAKQKYTAAGLIFE